MQSPHPAEIIFFSNISIKSVTWGLLLFFSFLQLHFVLKIDILMLLQYSLAEVVNSLQHLRHDKVRWKTQCPQHPCPGVCGCGHI